MSGGLGAEWASTTARTTSGWARLHPESGTESAVDGTCRQGVPVPVDPLKLWATRADVAMADLGQLSVLLGDMDS